MAGSAGVDLQAHTANHVRLADIPAMDARAELATCKDSLEQRLQRTIDTICYPLGSISDDVAATARGLSYSIGVTTGFGRVRQCDDPLQLPRIAVHYVPPFSLKYGLSGSNFWWRIKTRRDTRKSCQ